MPGLSLIDGSELQLLERVGAGGFGQVHRGVWKEVPVAVKALHPAHGSGETLRELGREARMT